MSEQRHDENQVQDSTPKATESRFDRRRFLRTSAAAAPVLMSLKTPMAWAGTAQCTASVYASANASHVHECEYIGPLSHGTWKRVLPSSPPNGSQTTRNYWRDALAEKNISEDDLFKNVLLGHFLSSRSKTLGNQNTTYYYQLDTSASSDPTLQEAIFEQNFNAIFKIQVGGSTYKIRLSYSNTSFLQILTAYLNASLSYAENGNATFTTSSGEERMLGPIGGYIDVNTVKDSFNSAITSMLFEVIDDIHNDSSRYSTTMINSYPHNNAWQKLVETCTSSTAFTFDGNSYNGLNGWDSGCEIFV